jgi:hypothetical protein
MARRDPQRSHAGPFVYPDIVSLTPPATANQHALRIDTPGTQRHKTSVGAGDSSQCVLAENNLHENRGESHHGENANSSIYSLTTGWRAPSGSGSDEENCSSLEAVPSAGSLKWLRASASEGKVKNWNP